MNIQSIHRKLEDQSVSGYAINEIIPFEYPYRRVRVNATVNKSPEEAIKHVYTVFIQTILAGYTREDQIVTFLGLHEDDFILRELYFLRERGYLDLVSGEWNVTESGHEFLKDKDILYTLENEKYEFLIDGITGEVLANNFSRFNSSKNDKRLVPEIDKARGNQQFLEDCSEQIADVYKEQHGGKAYLIDFDKSKLSFDKLEYQAYYYIEYKQRTELESDNESFIEIRNFDTDFSLDKRVTEILSDRYSETLYLLTDSERSSFAKATVTLNESFSTAPPKVDKSSASPYETLSIWQTQAKYIDTLRTVKSRMLIESPWIKQAVLKHIPLIEAALKRGVSFVVLYGIENADEHHLEALRSMEKLSESYELFHLIHLPSHFKNKNMHKRSGTHRKLIIKDDEYFIQGSFNFLSFNKNEGQKVANEESILISTGVQKKWGGVLGDYKIDIQI